MLEILEIMVQSFLFKKVVDQFMNQYERIMSNDPKADVEELLSVERAFVKDLKNITARQCFSSDEVLNLELTGDKVISTLLDVFVRTLTEHDGHELSDTRTYAGKIFRKNFHVTLFILRKVKSMIVTMWEICTLKI